MSECLLPSDRLDAVVGLAPNLFHSTTIPACLLIFRWQRVAKRRGHVLFVDGSKRFTKGRNQNHMPADDVVLRNSGLPPSGDLYDRAYAYIREHY